MNELKQGAQRLSASKINSPPALEVGIQNNSCAQRLSASKINSQNRIGEQFQHPVCSTPFGIKDQFTRSPPLSDPQRPGAQRLSASKINSRGNCGRAVIRSRMCSTPFGIKDQFTGCGKRRDYGRVPVVLNAFRHQRSIHALHVAIGVNDFDVLNAFRHQRSIHVTNDHVVAAAMLCSTPFGIKDQFTTHPGTPWYCRPEKAFFKLFSAETR